MGARQGPPGSLAARVTYLLEPKNWLIITVVAVGAHADGLAGAGWGLLAALFAAVLPTAFISYGIRRGFWEDRNVGARRPRLIVLAFITASAATGLVLLAGYLLVGWLGWSRVALRDHTTAQVIGGIVLGSAAAALAYQALSPLPAGPVWPVLRAAASSPVRPRMRATAMGFI